MATTMKKQTRFLLTSLILAASSMPLCAQNIAVVNGQRVTRARYDFLVKMLKEESDATGRPLPPNMETLIKQRMIENAVRVQAAEEKKLHLTPEYAERMTQARESVLLELLFRQFTKEHPISDASAKAEYEKVVAAHPAEQEYLARHILVKSETQAQQIQAELKKGQSFDKLAEKYSQDPGSAKHGGSLGWASAGTYVPEFAAALRQLRKGESTGKPVKTSFGYHIVRVDDVRSAPIPSFDSVKAQIKQQMQGQQTEAFQKYLQKLQSSAKIQ